jgi:hypothetical protein
VDEIFILSASRLNGMSDAFGRKSQDKRHSGGGAVFTLSADEASAVGKFKRYSRRATASILR